MTGECSIGNYKAKINESSRYYAGFFVAGMKKTTKILRVADVPVEM
jgi:hypothetical protein